MKILVLNAGSSSQKSCLYALSPDSLSQGLPPSPLWEAQVDWTHPGNQVQLKVETAQAKLNTTLKAESRGVAIVRLLESLWSGSTAVIPGPEVITAVGHRVVHGGQDYRASTRITPDVKAAIARLAAFAPIHNPLNLEGIEFIEQNFGTAIPQVAVFDTAFHSALPPAAYTYPGPYEWLEAGIRRYGFHGISHQYCAQRAAQLLGRSLPELRLIICHLGNGCSLSAVRGGYSVDTTMGFTPLEGLMMGTRSGSVDPGILIHLLRQHHYSADDLDRILNRESGLKGISGLSSDLRPIVEAIAQGHERAQLAVDVYIHRLRAAIGSMLASLGGLDALVFTAGIGENASLIRAGACEAFEFLGLHLDKEKNQQRRPEDIDLSRPESAVKILVIHTQEDWAIAQECWRLLHDS
jgi:acetate kinase